MHETVLLDKHLEFETKYRMDLGSLVMFKNIVSKESGLEKFLYVEGPDLYFIKPDGNFARYRKPIYGGDLERCEVTKKFKPLGAKNNNKRKELNVRVGNTPEDTIREDLACEGYVFNFSIYKLCHIYNFKDATVVFYTVYDTTNGKIDKIDHFIEIEVTEETIHKLTEHQAWDVINKYEKLLEPIGINPQKRLKKSLFEMYVRQEVR